MAKICGEDWREKWERLVSKNGGKDSEESEGRKRKLWGNEGKNGDVNFGENGDEEWWEGMVGSIGGKTVGGMGKEEWDEEWGKNGG